MSALLRLVAPVLLALIAAAVLAWLCDRNGYARARAHYEPILLQVGSQAVAAEERAKAVEAAAAAVNHIVSEEDRQRVEAAQAQRDDALRRIADMRLRLAKALAARCSVPAIPGGAPGPASAPGDAEGRAERADAALAGLGLSCQRDRDRLALWQQWYGRQAASVTGSGTATSPTTRNR